MSERSELAHRLAKIVNDHGMNNPFGGDVAQSGDKRYYDFLFSYPATLDGYVRVYGPRFILIQARGKLAPGGGDWSEAYDSEENAARVLTLIAEYKPGEAAEVPTKPRKERVA